MRLAIPIILAGCGAAAPAPAPVPAAAAAAAAPAAAGPRPIPPEATAGLYWLPYTTCDNCTSPSALAAYITPSEREARAITRALDGKLALGLPYVVHTDDLGVSPRGIAIVIGSFSSHAAADRARAAAPVLADRHALVLDVPTGDPGSAPVDSPRHVTVVDRGGPVPAWSAGDADAASQATDGLPVDSIEGMHDAVIRELRERAPLCTVQPGDLFVVAEADIRWYELAPVRCRGQLAYIPWTSSLLGHAAIVPDATGSGHRLFQIVGASCDSPIIRDWPYDAQGRHADPDSAPEVADGGGC